MPFGRCLRDPMELLKQILLNLPQTRHPQPLEAMILVTESNKNSEQGFIIISLAIVLSIAIIAISIGLSSGIKGIESNREYETSEELKSIKTAITGTSVEDFSFIGDMGRLPNNLEELNTIGTQTAFHTSDSGIPHFGSVGMGWRGPYYRYGKTTDDYLMDAWGRNYVYVITETNTTGGGLTLNQRTAAVISKGSDGIYPSADDIYSEEIPQRVNLIMKVVVGATDNIARNVIVYMYSSNNGEQTVVLSEPVTFSGIEGEEFAFPFSNLHQGAHAFNINFGAMDETGYLHIIGGDANRITISIPVGKKK